MASLLRFSVGMLVVLLIGGPVYSQSIAVLKFDQLNQLITPSDDTVRVVNFWATWCAPCVKELPLFEKLNQQYANRKLKVLLVSMDQKEVLQTKVKPFVSRRTIRSRVVLLDEPDLNSWIDKLAPEWSGALPMTLIISQKHKIRTFIGKPVKEGELESIINQYKL